MLGKRVLSILLVVVLIILIVQWIFPSSRNSEKPLVNIKDSKQEEGISDDSNVTFVSEYSKEQGIVNSCNTYLNSLFCGSKSDMQVSSDIYDSVISKVSAVSPNGGFMARQIDIRHSGLSDLSDGVYKYIAIARVYCINTNSESFSYDIIVHMSVDDSNVVTDFTLYSY